MRRICRGKEKRRRLPGGKAGVACARAALPRRLDQRVGNALIAGPEADEQLVVAAAKLAEATSDSEEYQRALFDYTSLVRHRMANPLQTIVGAAATLKARPALPSDQQRVLLDVIVKEPVVLERVCPTPKTMHPSEGPLAPTPVLAERASAPDETS